MAKTAFPHGWSVQNGIVGTDIDSSSTSVSGGTSVTFPSGGSGSTVLVSDWIAVSNTAVTDASTFRYSAGAVVRASDASSGKDIKIEIEYSDQTRSSISSVTIFNSNLSAANDWLTISQVTAVFGTAVTWFRFKISRPTDTDFDLFIDQVELKQLPSGMDFSPSGGSNSFTASWARIKTGFTVQGFSTSPLFGDGRALLHASGVYTVSADLTLEDSYDAGDMFGIRVLLRDYTGAATGYIYGSSVSVPAAYNAATNNLGLSVSGQHFFDSFALRSANPCGIEVQVIQYTNTGSLKTYTSSKANISRITDR